jgi:soluble lytic murein transglycosylase-like protein
MKKKVFAGIFATAILAAAFTIPANAGCRDIGTCSQRTAATKTTKTASAKKAVASRRAVSRTRVAKAKTRRYAARKSLRRTHAVAPAAPSRNSGQVVALITSMAPSHGVPAWFALKIARVESNYNPNARGSAGELGVFQLKCATARGIGYRGSCSGLLDARTNVQYGLKHLALAMRSSKGNLRLAASKHNGGLGRKTEVRGYVAKVF